MFDIYTISSIFILSKYGKFKQIMVLL